MACKLVGNSLQINGAFSHMNLYVGAFLIIVLVVTSACWAVWQRWRRTQPRHGPAALFTELCCAHGLSRHERWLLWRFARQLPIEPPTRLFLEPHWLEPTQITKASGGLTHDQAARIREVVFGESGK